MKRWLILFACILSVVLASVLAFFYWTHRDYLGQAEGELNSLYRKYRPFAYRWKGAPAGGSVTDECGITPKAARQAETAIDKEKQRSGKTVRVLQLSGRLRLLQGHFDEAVEEYRRALYLSSENRELKLELAITYAARARCEKNQSLDYEFAMEQMLALDDGKRSAELTFDIAVLMAAACLPHASLERWMSVIQTEPSTEWRNEAYLRLAKVQYLLMHWEQRLHDISSSPTSYRAHLYDAANSIEVVLAAALQDWLPNYHDDPATQDALNQLSVTLETYSDLWLKDLLQTPMTAIGIEALRSLAASSKENNAGEHIRAARDALRAEKLFRKINNPAGTLQARLELTYSLDRRWYQDECLAAGQNLSDEANRNHYLWIAAQASLERISCLIQTRRVDVIADCERAYKSIPSRYRGLRLRAMSFLTQKYLSFDRRLRLWTYGLQGLEIFWDEPLPLNRGYTLYYTIGSSARAAGNNRAALALLEEGVRILKESPYRQLYALALSDLGEWQFEQGRHADARRTFNEMDALFQDLDPDETKRFRGIAEITRAELETRANEPNQGLQRLLKVTKDMKFPYRSLSPTEHRLLLPAFGNAYLRSGDIDKAFCYYQRAIDENEKDLRSIQDPSQRDNAQNEIEMAWKGQTEIFLRMGKVSQALDLWETFRGQRISSRVVTVGKHSVGTLYTPTRCVHAPNRLVRIGNPPAGASFLVFAFLPSGLYGWLKDVNGVEQHLLDATKIKQSIEHFSLLAADPNSQQREVDDESLHLYKTLVKPFEQRLKTANLLIIDADGPLAGLPWAALIDDHRRTLLEKFAIDQVVGLTEATKRLSKENLWAQPLILSDPTLGDSLRPDYPPLDDARREADWLQRRLPNAWFFPQETASTSNLLKSLPHSTLFHFGGHGVSYGGFGALLLAPPSKDTKVAAYITANEIAGLKLADLQLVVLAACSSGVGEQQGTVNLDGLVRSFLEAGAWRVVAARWNVRSQATTDIVIQFYQLVFQGIPPAEALREATVSFYQRSGVVHPYYWAGLQIFGAP